MTFLLLLNFIIVFLCPGAKIIIACRDMEKAQSAVKEIIQSSSSENVVCMKLDLSNSKSIREFAEAINKGKSGGSLESLHMKDVTNHSGVRISVDVVFL